MVAKLITLMSCFKYQFLHACSSGLMSMVVESVGGTRRLLRTGVQAAVAPPEKRRLRPADQRQQRAQQAQVLKLQVQMLSLVWSMSHQTTSSCHGLGSSKSPRSHHGPELSTVFGQLQHHTPSPRHHTSSCPLCPSRHRVTLSGPAGPDTRPRNTTQIPRIARCSALKGTKAAQRLHKPLDPDDSPPVQVRARVRCSQSAARFTSFTHPRAITAHLSDAPCANRQPYSPISLFN